MNNASLFFGRSDRAGRMRSPLLRLLTMIAALLILITGFAVSVQAEEATFLAAPDSKSLTLTIQKDGKKITSSDSQAQTVQVLEWTDWTVQAKFIVVKEGKSTTSTVTGACAWTPSDGLSYDSQANSIRVGEYSGQQQTISATYTHEGETYTAQIHFNVIKLGISGNSHQLLCLALSELACDADQLSAYAGKTVREYIADKEANGTHGSYLLPGNHYKEDHARTHHFFASAAGDAVILSGRTVSSGFKTAVFRHSGNVYIAYSYGRGYDPSTTYSGSENCRESALIDYYNWAGSSKNVVVVGYGDGGVMAEFVSYTTGCRAVSLMDESLDGDGLYYAINRDFNAVCAKYSEKGIESLRMRYRYSAPKRSGTNADAYIVRGALAMLSYGFETETVSCKGSNNSQKLFADSHLSAFFMGHSGINVLNLPSQKNAFDAQIRNYFLGGGGDDDIRMLTGTDASMMKDVNLAKESLIQYSKNKLFELLKVGPLAGTMIGIAQSKLNSENYAVGGKGNDTIQGSAHSDIYYYQKGDGHDIINDLIGFDSIYLDGYTAQEITIAKDSYSCSIKANGVEIIKLDGMNGYGSVTVYVGNPMGHSVQVSNGKINRLLNEQCTYHYTGSGTIKVYDEAENLVWTMANDSTSEYNKELSCGKVVATNQDGKFERWVFLNSSGCKVEIVGESAGGVRQSAAETFSCEVLYLNLLDDTVKTRKMYDVPLYPDSRIYVTAGSGGISMQADWDGDGIIDGNAGEETVVTLNQSDVTLPYGEQLTLMPSVSPASMKNRVTWLSLDESIASVDENGVVTACGFGKTAVVASTMDGGEKSTAVCIITVPEETLSAEQFRLTGLETSYDYTGHYIVPEVQVYYKNLPLGPTDCIVGYADNLYPGQATLTVTGAGSYTGSKNFSFTIEGITDPTVEEKVDQIAAECRKAGVTGEYEIALWLHDWLTENANYDYTYTYYYPNGVLLENTGVCQSYSMAYELLLDEFGIENMLLSSPEMDHAWNLVKLDGSWYHVDSTWDDPGMGGMENHSYFMISDRIISADHVWDRSKYPAANSDSLNYNLLHGGYIPAYDLDDVYSAIYDQIAAGSSEVRIISMSDSLNLLDAFELWQSEESWRYQYDSYSYTPSEVEFIIEFFSYSGVIDISLNYTGDTERLKEEIRSQLATGKTSFTVHDGTWQGGSWDPSEVAYLSMEIVDSFGSDFACSADYSYSYSPYGKTVTISVTYIKPSDLPEPFDTIGPIAGSEFEYAGLSGNTIRKSDYLGNLLLVVYGRAECPNTMNLLGNLNASASLWQQEGVQVVAVLEDTANVPAAAESYPRFIYGLTDYYPYMWDDMEAVGNTGGSVTFPAVFLYDENGMIIYHSTGYVYEPLRLISLMLSDEAKAEEPEVVLQLPVSLQAIADEAFAGNAAVTKIIIPDGAESIGSGAFRDSPNLRYVVIPESVFSIEADAFAGCPNAVIECAAGSAAYWHAVMNAIPVVLTAAD